MIMFESVKILAHTNPAALDSFVTAQPQYVEPFSKARLDDLHQLSKLLLREPILRHDPATVALAFWLRKSNLNQIFDRFKAQFQGSVEIFPVPVGTVFHIAPSNVTTMFAYSWALSYLCGNRNIVRISSQENAVVAKIISTIENAMQDSIDLQINNRFITYNHDDSVTETISRFCDHRVIWGGDETATRLRPLYLSPHASERIFGSKYSYSVVAADSFLNAEAIEHEKLIEGFFNDIFWFDQMACSSPHAIFWVGSHDKVQQAIGHFNRSLERIGEYKQYQVSSSASVRRISYAFEIASEHRVKVDLAHHKFVTISTQGYASLRKEICGGGLLTHVQVDRLNDVVPFASSEDQTITHFGFSYSNLLSFARAVGAKGIDRVVPVGNALDFSSTWDGFDLLRDFTKLVTLSFPLKDSDQ